jgi:hypothetical protein
MCWTPLDSTGQHYSRNIISNSASRARSLKPPPSALTTVKLAHVLHVAATHVFVASACSGRQLLSLWAAPLRNSAAHAHILRTVPLVSNILKCVNPRALAASGSRAT